MNPVFCLTLPFDKKDLMFVPTYFRIFILPHFFKNKHSRSGFSPTKKLKQKIT